MSEMSSFEPLKIDLISLKQGETVLSFDLGDDYFAAVDGSETKRGTVKATVVIRRTGDIFELDIHTDGKVIVPCDICLDDMEQPIATDNRLTARLGNEDTEEDDLITVDKSEGLLDLSWHIYEFIALGIPIKHVHEEGQCDPAMLKALEEHTAGAHHGEGESKAVDSRWSELEKLKTIIKD